VTIADRLAAPPVKQGRCGMGKVLDTISVEDRAAITAAFDNPAFPTSEIHRAVQAEGYPIGYNVLRMHRIRTCCCVPR
jgi:hypothetical protein